ncbi:hypothetical protein IFM89_032675, partial [Coptis chinensis]
NPLPTQRHGTSADQDIQDSERLAMLFEKAGIVYSAEVIYNRDTGQSRGFGFVTMTIVDEAEKAIDMFKRYDLTLAQILVRPSFLLGDAHGYAF